MELSSTPVHPMELIDFFFPRLIFCLFCGGLVGLERELKQKAAGIKTNILICMGSMLFTSISVLISQANSGLGFVGDPGRVAAQIVSGIGFLGGGVILQARGNIVGLTTAATIWVVAAIGVALGIGRYDVAMLSSVVVVVTLILVSQLEERVIRRSHIYRCEVSFDDKDPRVRSELVTLLIQHDLHLIQIEKLHKDEIPHYALQFRGSSNDRDRFFAALFSLQAVHEVKKI